MATLFALLTCAFGVLPTEIFSVPEEKGPDLVQPPGSVVLHRGGIPSLLINFSDPSEDYIPASRPEKSEISHDGKSGKTFPTHGLVNAIYSLTQNNFKKIPCAKLRRGNQTSRKAFWFFFSQCIVRVIKEDICEKPPWACSLINNNNLFLDTNSFIIFLEEFKSHLFLKTVISGKSIIFTFPLMCYIPCCVMTFQVSSSHINLHSHMFSQWNLLFGSIFIYYLITLMYLFYWILGPY